MSTQTGGSFFPKTRANDYPNGSGGATLLDWFAGQALAGVTSREDGSQFPKDSLPGETITQWRERVAREEAEFCYRYARAMVLVRERLLRGGAS